MCIFAILPQIWNKFNSASRDYMLKETLLRFPLYKKKFLISWKKIWQTPGNILGSCVDIWKNFHLKQNLSKYQDTSIWKINMMNLSIWNISLYRVHILSKTKFCFLIFGLIFWTLSFLFVCKCNIFIIVV